MYIDSIYVHCKCYQLNTVIGFKEAVRVLCQPTCIYRTLLREEEPAHLETHIPMLTIHGLCVIAVALSEARC